MDQLLENQPLASILAYFEARGLALTVHTSPPPPASPEEMRRLPRVVRRAIEEDESAFWADLGDVARHYGGGQTEEEAIRSAARRYRVEQAPEGAGSS